MCYFFQPVFLTARQGDASPELSSHWHQLRPGSPLDHSVDPGSLRYAKPTLGGGDRDLAVRNSWSGHMVVAAKIWRDNAEPRDFLHTPKMGSDWPVMAI